MAYVIQRGYSGLAVKKMQEYLNALRTLYPELPLLQEDGYYGNEMEEAVRIFQAQTGLNVDGIIGSMTWDKIICKYKTLDDPQPEPVECPPLEYGDTGLDVQKMQCYLNQLTLPETPIATDGVFGAQMEAKVITFQNAHGLVPDGKIGELTWDKIIELI